MRRRSAFTSTSTSLPWRLTARPRTKTESILPIWASSITAPIGLLIGNMFNESVLIRTSEPGRHPCPGEGAGPAILTAGPGALQRCEVEHVAGGKGHGGRAVSFP